MFAELLTSPMTGVSDAVSSHTIIQHLCWQRASLLANTLGDTAGSSPRSPPRGFWPRPPWHGGWAGPGHLLGSCRWLAEVCWPFSEVALGSPCEVLVLCCSRHPLLLLPLHKGSVKARATWEFSSLFQKLKERWEVPHKLNLALPGLAVYPRQ